MPVIRPGAELHDTLLLVERKVGDVDGTRALVNCWRDPLNQTIGVYEHIRLVTNFVIAISTSVINRSLVHRLIGNWPTCWRGQYLDSRPAIPASTCQERLQDQHNKAKHRAVGSRSLPCQEGVWERQFLRNQLLAIVAGSPSNSKAENRHWDNLSPETGNAYKLKPDVGCHNLILFVLLHGTEKMLMLAILWAKGKNHTTFMSWIKLSPKLSVKM